jgi:hypothetical protein
MSDVVVTVPKGLWPEWLEEGDLAGEPWSEEAEYHFWIRAHPLPGILPGERVYIVAHNRLRGYAPLVRIEGTCKLAPSRACLVRRNEASYDLEAARTKTKKVRLIGNSVCPDVVRALVAANAPELARQEVAA